MKFNLSKYAQEGQRDQMVTEPAMEILNSSPSGVEMSIGEPESLMRDEDNIEKFLDHAHLRDTLASMSLDKAISAFVSKIDDKSVVDDESGSIVNPRQTVKDGIQRFYEPDVSSEGQLDIANEIFDALPLVLKSDEYQQPAFVGSEQEIVASIVVDTDEILEKAAKSFSGSSKNRIFNLSKTAQAHSFQHNMFLYGPEQTRMSPFTRDIQSGLHLIEQNKGFGLKIDDILDIDFEAIWRGNIMDKYSRPYKNEKGEWVGGYINKRFEVNQWIPEGNNLQLAPNKRSRPYMPEYGNYEARLEVDRGEVDRLSNPMEIEKINLASNAFNLSKKKVNK
jgi:hypothetical protein